jgi:hypothetical protein
MRLGFIMPNEKQRDAIGRFRESIVEMRPDQLKYFEHLLHSWGIFGRLDGIELTWRAIKKTLHERP